MWGWNTQHQPGAPVFESGIFKGSRWPVLKNHEGKQFKIHIINLTIVLYIYIMPCIYIYIMFIRYSVCCLFPELTSRNRWLQGTANSQHLRPQMPVENVNSPERWTRWSFHDCTICTMVKWHSRAWSNKCLRDYKGWPYFWRKSHTFGILWTYSMVMFLHLDYYYTSYLLSRYWISTQCAYT